jgi:hypothetical protein
MKRFFLLICFSIFALGLFAQKKVEAMANLMTQTTDTVLLPKGKALVVMLPIRNRAGDDWQINPLPEYLKLTDSYIGQVGMLPNQEEPKLFFFKAQDKGQDSIRFMYKNPKALPDALPEYRTVYVIVN